METSSPPPETLATRPICVGLTCWRWQKTKSQVIKRLADNLGVTVRLTEKIHGLHREIRAEVVGRNTDRFIGEFVRHC